MNCACCGSHVEGTGGCFMCGSSKTYCATCGALVVCGCGRGLNVVHTCPNIYCVTADIVTIKIPGQSIIPEGIGYDDTGMWLN